MPTDTLNDRVVTFDVAELPEPTVSVIGVMLDDVDEIRAESTLNSWESDNTATCTWAECCDNCQATQ